ncbi:MAG: methyl-accepting chemotaxis protein [Candidatus Omnitrophota bacterium]|nr:MAG: methyl-accepting chemotaxis protein [Candidatus Omnitrophota bacterium]
MGRFKGGRGKLYRLRRLHFLSNQFQRSFVIKFCLIIVAGALISGAVIYLKSQTTVTTVFEDSRLKIKSTADFILPAVLLSSAVVIAVVGISAIIVTLWSYRRIERLLFQMEEEIEEADAGNLNVQLRPGKNVEFKVLALSLNKLIRDFRKLIVTAKNDVFQLESDFEKIEKKEGQAIPEKIKADLEVLKEELSRFST